MISIFRNRGFIFLLGPLFISGLMLPAFSESGPSIENLTQLIDKDKKDAQL